MSACVASSWMTMPCHSISTSTSNFTTLHNLVFCMVFAWRTSQINLHPQFTFLTTAPPFGRPNLSNIYLTGSHSPVDPHHTRYMTPGTLYNHSWQVIVARNPRNLVFCEMKKKSCLSRLPGMPHRNLISIDCHVSHIGKSTFLVQPKTIRFPF